MRTERDNGMDLRIELTAAEDLSPERKELLTRAYQREFGWDKMVYDASRWYVIGTHQERLVGQVGILEREISVGGESLRIGGIHGVITEPEYRCRGTATALMGRAVDFITDERHLSFALLTCQPRLGDFYEQLGWKTTAEPCMFQQPDGPRSCGGLTMIIECGLRSWPPGRIDLCGLPW
jgi:predicted acetyltransferase